MTRKKLDGPTKNIAVTEETHQKLMSLGSKDETFNDIIQKLIKLYEKKFSGDGKTNRRS